VDLAAILTGIGAILTAAGGTVLVIREFRRRDRKAANQEIESLSSDLHRCRAVHIKWRGYAFELRERLADHGLQVPDPPEDV
jgi:hypothetical protein